LSVLAREAPAHYARLCAILADVPLEIDLAGSVFVLRVESGVHRLEAPAAGAKPLAEVHADAATIVSLLDGEQSLVDAALADRLWLRGSVEHVARFERALGVFMDGAVRCREMPVLLVELRGASDARAAMEETRCPS
jgi:hypothetical protein